MFSRLGGGQEDGSWLRDGPKAGVADEDDSDGEGSVLQYAGVLKRPPPSAKKEPTAPAAATASGAAKPAKFTLRRLGKKLKRPATESSPPLPSSTSSSSSNSALEGAPKRSVLHRLGKAPSGATGSRGALVASSMHSDALPLASPKVSSSTGVTATGSAADCPSAQMDAAAVSVFKRLGTKRT